MSNDRNQDEVLSKEPATPEELKKLSQTLVKMRNDSAEIIPETAELLRELSDRVFFWEQQLSKGKQTHPRHLEIMAIYHYLEKELEHTTEFDVFGNQLKIKVDEKEVTTLFELLDSELSSEHTKHDIKSTFSETKTLDRSELEKEFRELEKHALKDISEEHDTTNDYEFDFEEFESSEMAEREVDLPSPSFLKVFLATFTDMLLLISATGGYFYYKNPLFQEIISSKTIPDNLNTLISPAINFGVTTLSLWIIALLFFSVLYDGSPAQKMFGIVICNKDGSTAKIRQLFIRFLFHLLNITTLGIRPLIMAFRKNGYYCRFSKTRLTQ